MRHPNVSLIAACGNSGQLGLDGTLPWPHNADDMRWFRRQTTDGLLVCGKRTFETLARVDGTYGRQVLQFTRSLTHTNVLQIAERDGHEMVWICGGASTYKVWLPYASKVYIGLIDYDGPADTYMPRLWQPRSQPFEVR